MELHKLTNDNKKTDKYNIHLLIRKLKRGGVYQSIDIDSDKIIKWQNDLNNHYSSIEEVSRMRSKLYAHSDKDFKEVIEESSLTLKSTESLIDEVVQIIFEINLLVFDEHHHFKPIYKRQSLERTIENLLSKRQDNRLKLLNQIKKNK